MNWAYFRFKIHFYLRFLTINVVYVYSSAICKHCPNRMKYWWSYPASFCWTTRFFPLFPSSERFSVYLPDFLIACTNYCLCEIQWMHAAQNAIAINVSHANLLHWIFQIACIAFDVSRCKITFNLPCCYCISIQISPMINENEWN